MDVASYPAPWILENKRKEHRAQNLDIWMRDMAQIKNYRPLTLEHIEELLTKSQDPVQREFGLEFDTDYTFHVPVSYTHLDVYKRQCWSWWVYPESGMRNIRINSQAE